MTRFGLWFLMAALLTAPVAAQGQKRPESWKVRLDRGAPGVIPDSLLLVDMPPGWHVTTTRYSGIFYDPAWQAEGDFRITAQIFLFPDSRQEGYGVFFGGRELEGPGQRYVYVLLRKDGAYLVKRREGSDTREIVPWTPSPAVAALAPGATSNVKNDLVIEASGDRVRVLVNDQELGSWPRATLDGGGAGQVGLRLNHGLNLHVSKLTIEPIAQ